MSITVRTGQVWRDKDKRRNTTIEIIDTFHSDENGDMALGLVVGTEIEREYRAERLAKKWELVQDKQLADLVSEVVEEIPEHVVIHKTREEWLEAAVVELSKRFADIGYDVPSVRVSVGWPGGRGKKQGVIGQCFATTSAGDNVAQIFVSPVVDAPLNVLIVLAHELIHAIDDCKSGHKKDFVKIAKEIGFTPKWTVATPDTITDELEAELHEVYAVLGDYPHSAIKTKDRPQVQKTYMLKIVSPENPDFFVRMTAGKIEEFGLPHDPWGNEMELEEK